MSKKVVVVFRKLQSHEPVVTTVTEIPTFSDDSDSSTITEDREQEFALKTLSDTRISVCARFAEFNEALWTFEIHPLL